MLSSQRSQLRTPRGNSISTRSSIYGRSRISFRNTKIVHRVITLKESHFPHEIIRSCRSFSVYGYSFLRFGGFCSFCLECTLLL